MSNFNFLHNPAINQSFTGTVSNNLITLASGTYDEGDIVYIPYNDVGSVYAYCSDPTTNLFTFNDEVYTDVSSNISTSKGKYWEVNDIIYDDVQSYRISSLVEKGLYSKAYFTYKTSVEYSLIVSVQRREFFSGNINKSVRTLLLANDVVFSDSCDGVAYGIGFSEGTFDTLNNKFKSSLEFNIATR